ncbi:MAG: hypothetical protein JF593_05235 [Novosphingobium sp.]|nr:hypothetical protein [Novosphingobium sp.]
MTRIGAAALGDGVGGVTRRVVTAGTSGSTGPWTRGAALEFAGGSWKSLGATGVLWAFAAPGQAQASASAAHAAPPSCQPLCPFHVMIPGLRYGARLNSW